MAPGITDFAAFYRRHAPDVFRFAYFLSGDRSEAEDITSETFVRVWAAADRIDAATVKGYLFTVARNLHRRSARRRGRHVVLPDALHDPRADPSAAAESASELAAVERRLAALSEVDRTALLLRAVDGMPYEEIARTLGITPVAARVKVHRARLALAAFSTRHDEP